MYICKSMTGLAKWSDWNTPQPPPLKLKSQGPFHLEHTIQLFDITIEIGPFIDNKH